ncbi:hypothetical protein ABZZ20_24160 [Streptomyces sp. NPDC006430]|uniref:hypothetical protein n=1 Tax=Streptomyces sp. NPDC006430 TaxID=3154299 RepID=UPI0033B7600C
MVLLDFGANWCGNCKAADQVFTQSQTAGISVPRTTWSRWTSAGTAVGRAIRRVVGRAIRRDVPGLRRAPPSVGPQAGPPSPVHGLPGPSA